MYEIRQKMSKEGLRSGQPGGQVPRQQQALVDWILAAQARLIDAAAYEADPGPAGLSRWRPLDLPSESPA